MSWVWRSASAGSRILDDLVEGLMKPGLASDAIGALKPRDEPLPCCSRVPSWSERRAAWDGGFSVDDEGAQIAGLDLGIVLAGCSSWHRNLSAGPDGRGAVTGEGHSLNWAPVSGRG